MEEKFDKPTESNLSKSIHELQQMALNNEIDIEQLLRNAYFINCSNTKRYRRMD